MGVEKPTAPGSTMSALPDRCPLVTGNLTTECRFAPKLFRELYKEGVFKDGCPIENVCRMKGTADGNSREACRPTLEVHPSSA